MNRQTPLKAIKLQCIECVGGVRYVKDCSSENCSLYPFRFGKNPYVSGRKMSEEQRLANIERLKKYREENQ